MSDKNDRIKNNVIKLIGLQDKGLGDKLGFARSLGLFKQGGLVGYPRRVGLMPVPIPFVEPQIMALGGAVMSKQIAHNTQLKKLGGKVKGKDVGNVDTVPTLLAVNEIVIPRKIAQSKKFKNYLSKNYNYNQKNGKFKNRS
jgi:hypothetical protein